MTASGATAPPRIGLPPEQFAAAFPFHIAVDATLAVLQAGTSLSRVCPDVQAGAGLARLFRALRPEGQLTLDWVLEHRSRFFLLEHVASGLQLRGEFVVLPGEGRLLFLGSPWLTDSSEIATRGLGFEDFAIHDPAVDLLQVFQANKMALADAQKLATKLSAQREELRSANQRLREQESQARLLALIAARTENGVVLTDAEGHVTWVNEGFTRMTGYVLDEISGRKPGAILQGPGTDRATARLQSERIREGKGFKTEILNYRKDGSEYWAALEVQPIADAEGRLINFMSIQSDITERRATQQRLAIQFEVAAVLADSDDLRTAISRVLAVICERLGWQVGQIWQVTGDCLRMVDAWHSPSAGVEEFVDASRALPLARGKGYPGRVWATKSPVWLADVTIAPGFLRAAVAARSGLRGGFAIPLLVRGEVWGVAEFLSRKIEDPDEALLKSFATIGFAIGAFILRQQAMADVRSSEERFRTAFEDAQAGIALVSLEGRFLWVNRTLCEMFGYTREELTSKTYIEITHPDDSAASAAAAKRMFSEEVEGIGLEKRYVRKDGKVVWAILRARRQRGAGGSADLVVAHFLDISERRAAEQTLREDKRLLEEAQQRELQTGFEIQRSLLIGEVPAGIRGAEMAGYAVPSRGIDGDFYAFTRFGPDCFELLVGDVMGKGVPAALVGAAVRTAYNQVVTELIATSKGSSWLPQPADIVNALHRALTSRLVELDTFVTLALYRFDLARGNLTFVNAGHTAGLLLRAGGGVESILGENVPLGVAEDEQYTELVRPIGAGDALLAYSDGLTEARNAENVELGEVGLGNFLREVSVGTAPTAIRLQALRKRVREFVGKREMPDDETAVMVGLRGPFAAPEAPDAQGRGEETLELPWDISGLAPLRQRVAAAAAGLGETAANLLVLAAFEAATNIVRHVPRAFDDATLSCRLQREADRVTVELWYIGPPFEPQAIPEPDASGASEGGFGLHIIDSAVSSASYEHPAPDVCCTRLVQLAGVPAQA